LHLLCLQDKVVEGAVFERKELGEFGVIDNAQLGQLLFVIDWSRVRGTNLVLDVFVRVFRVVSFGHGRQLRDLLELLLREVQLRFFS